MVDERRMGAAPSIDERVDLRSLQLSEQETFLLSQIDGQKPARQLCGLLAIEEQALAEMLARLQKLGAVQWGDGGRAAGSDLSSDEQQQIIDMEQRSRAQTYWRLLGVSPDASVAEIKRAYFALSKSFHPDRFFGRDLGEFRQRIEVLFLAIKAAYDTLCDPERSADYRARHPVFSAPKPAGETREQREARLEARRQQIIEERKARKLGKGRQSASRPKAASVGANRSGEEMFKAGLAQLKAGDVNAAVVSFRLALTYDPNNARYRATFDEANEQAMVRRAQQVAEAAAAAAKSGEKLKAAEEYVRAFQMAPSRAEYAIEAARQFLGVSKLDKACEYARQAVEVAPNRREAREVAAAAFDAAGERAVALEHARAARRLPA